MVVDRVVVFVQENHTVDEYCSSLHRWGANVATGWPVQANPPAHAQPHNRAAYAKWLHAQEAGMPSPAAHVQMSTDMVLPFYAWLAKTGAFFENHCPGSGRTPPRTTYSLWAGEARPCGTRLGLRRTRCGTYRRCPVTLATTG